MGVCGQRFMSTGWYSEHIVHHGWNWKLYQVFMSIQIFSFFFTSFPNLIYLIRALDWSPGHPLHHDSWHIYPFGCADRGLYGHLDFHVALVQQGELVILAIEGERVIQVIRDVFQPGSIHMVQVCFIQISYGPLFIYRDFVFWMYTTTAVYSRIQLYTKW